MKIQILPSLLAGDFGKLADEARRAEDAGGDALHLDIMDGVFVPNISMGPAVVEMARRTVRMPLSVHLMLIRPDQYLNNFIDAGADSLLIHIESQCNVPESLLRIRELGARPGITLNPETSEKLILPVLSKVDEVLCMTVRPGYGGQTFMPEVLSKIRSLRSYANGQKLHDLDILVDGGIDLTTAPRCAAEGANVFVAGTSLYDADDMRGEIALMRERTAAVFSA
jgi:ribulose-phosphate 3-epimerase